MSCELLKIYDSLLVMLGHHQRPEGKKNQSVITCTQLPPPDDEVKLPLSYLETKRECC